MLKKTLLFILISVLVLFVIGCGDKAATSEPEIDEIIHLGAGKKTVHLTVTDQNGDTAAFEVYTNKSKVGEALRDVLLIEGKDGLYDTVNGNTLDFNKDGLYWAFYVDGKYVNYGIDDAKIDQNAKYSLKAQK